ncbi:SCO family protein [Aureimonas sp. AU20]|uniref:SCO family protein n=1 Tax=Aureimonas sp. AU20 TaxID=1349819 RepID=UPI000720A0F2|nr:SCO family protein [Aureimonas sp. AU20]ALN73496.1 hypothetical protein M673_12300 [Aureimonas sp. AU20]
MASGNANRLLAFGGAGTLIAVLLGLIGWMVLNQPARGAPDQAFSLSDTRGGTVDQSVLKGRPSLIYFGYTNCPEVCPTTLIEMADWLNALGPDGRDLQALFFTVDPERDTLDVLRPYVASISDRIVGVTGSPAEMEKASKAWLVYSRKTGEGEDYHMRHSTSLLMIGANGRLQGMIPYGTPREEAIAKIRNTLLTGAPPAPSAARDDARRERAG